MKIVKNKLAPPFARIEFDLMYGLGISKEGEVIDLATNKDIVEKSGAWYSYKERKNQPWAEKMLRKYLKEQPKIMAELCQKLFELHSIKRSIPEKEEILNGKGPTKQVQAP